MTFLEAKEELAMKLDIDYSDIANNQLFSAADLGRYLKTAILKAWDYKPWDFAQGAKKITSIDATYYDYPTDLKNGSIYILTVNEVEFRKLRHEDYVKKITEDSATTDKIWSQYKRFIFVNKNAYSVGDIISMFGTLKAPIISADVDLMPFSLDSDNEENSGNGAIIQLAYADALGSEKKKNKAQSRVERQEAYETLGLIWEPLAEARSASQSEGRPFFEIPDFFSRNGGGINNSSIGKF